MSIAGKKASFIVVFVLLWAVAGPTLAAEKYQRIPLTFDFEMLSQMARQIAFNEPNHSATVYSAHEGCWQIQISDPRYDRSDELLRLTLSVSLQVGTPLGGNCLIPFDWQGRLVLLQKPQMDARRWRLSFQTVDSQLTGTDGEAGKMVATVWESARPAIHEYLDTIEIDLSGCIQAITHVLPEFFDHSVQADFKKMLQTLEVDAFQVTDQALQTHLLFAMDRSVFTLPEATDERPLNDHERERLIERWQTWDQLLVETLLMLSGETLDDDDRNLLVAVLLDARHQFLDIFEQPVMGPQDPVRQLFVRSWQRLAPLFRKRVLVSEKMDLFSIVAFISAADALVALDRLGPDWGIEISREGLLRLARIMQPDQPSQLLYTDEVQPGLQRLFGIEPPVLAPAAALETPPAASIILPAAVGIRPASTTAALSRWLVTSRNFENYRQQVLQLLQRNIHAAIQLTPIEADFKDTFQETILATAWQESCMRQFVVRKKKLVFLRSYNGSSVGLMQINERIWRGLYRLDRLRWDIGYNAQAGCRILAMYFKRYAQPRLSGTGAPTPDKTRLAQALYAMYNGGPGQWKRFFKREREQKLYSSDRLFLAKLQWVKAGQMERLRDCLFGI